VSVPTALEATSLGLRLRALRLPSFVAHYEDVAGKVEHEGLDFLSGLMHLAELELFEREVRKIGRLRKRSKLPPEKTLANLDTKLLATKVRRQLTSLCEGGFVGRVENVLAFGLPGRGKSHVVAAIGNELVARGISV